VSKSINHGLLLVGSSRGEELILASGEIEALQGPPKSNHVYRCVLLNCKKGLLWAFAKNPHIQNLNNLKRDEQIHLTITSL